MKRSVLTIVLFNILFSGCKEQIPIYKISGEAQGTTYHISWQAKGKTVSKAELDSLLKAVDLSLSTYVPNSVISRINKNDSTVIADRYFNDVFDAALKVSEKTNGLFDITVAPLVNAWGFGFTKKANVDSAVIDSILTLVGYKKIRSENGKILKDHSGTMIDFNAIAQGYTVDLLAAFLDEKGCTNYLVELGGEVKGKGKKNEKEYWRVGIDKPADNATPGRELQGVIRLHDKALATSGNYRKFYVENGRRISHIIDPRTGYPAKQNLLSATVVADDCMTADAYATAFMVMGYEQSLQFLSANPDMGLEVFFVYDDHGEWRTYSSGAMKEWMEETD